MSLRIKYEVGSCFEYSIGLYCFQGLTESSLCFLFRFSAAWKYILNLSKEEYSEKMILQILEIINKIATVVPVSITVSEMIQGFQQSVLFGSVLPGFINEVTGRPSHVRYFLSFNIPVERDSFLDPSAYRFGKCAGREVQKSSGVEIEGTVGISAQDTQTIKQIISNTVKTPISHHV